VARKIVLTVEDHRDLCRWLDSEMARSIPSNDLDDLRLELGRARTVPKSEIAPDIVTMGSSFTVLDLDSEETDQFTLVFPGQADIANGRLSVLAPIGTAVLGYRLGDTIRWRVPAGIRKLKIIEVNGMTESDKSQPQLMTVDS
jgi:regulator of nucleoside diphosphate kinase